MMYVRSAAFIVIKADDLDDDPTPPPGRPLTLLDEKALCETRPRTRLAMRTAPRAHDVWRERMHFMMLDDDDDVDVNYNDIMMMTRDAFSHAGGIEFSFFVVLLPMRVQWVSVR
jgi:hypothetical protein